MDGQLDVQREVIDLNEAVEEPWKTGLFTPSSDRDDTT